MGDCRRALTPDGTLVLNSGTGAHGLAMLVRLARPFVLSPFVRQDLRRFLSHPSRADLEFLTGLVEEGKLRPVIDTTYALGDIPEALRQIEAGHVRGKVVVTVAERRRSRGGLGAERVRGRRPGG